MGYTVEKISGNQVKISFEVPAQAFDEALALRPEGGMLFCAGSLYLVGEIKEHLQKEHLQ